MADTARALVAERVKRNAGQTLFPAVLVLLIGWVFFKLSPTYETASDYVFGVMIWSLRIGGIVLLLAAALCWRGVLFGMVIDAIVSTLLTIAFVAAAVVLIRQPGAQLMGIVVAVFAIVYARAAYVLWKDYGVLRCAVAGGGDADPGTAGERAPADLMGGATSEETPGVPATDAPRRGEPAGERPPNGFLSKMADEKKPSSDS